VNLCARPLDPLDAEALASGTPPVHAADAAEHSRACSSCSARVSAAAALARELDSLGGLGGLSAEGPSPNPAPFPDIAGRVLRLRPFSRRELKDLTLWKGPCLLAAALFVSGLVVLALPGISARAQAGLAAAAFAPAAAFLRAAARWFLDLAAAFPTGLEALGQAMRREQAIGLACLLLLAPVVWVSRRAFARVSRR
jgi:hypothetical protein